MSELLHARERIVQAAALAVAGLPSTGARVFPGRSWPMAASEPHHLLLYAREEASQGMTANGPARRLGRQVELTIESVLNGGADTDAPLNRSALEIETAIAADPTLGGVARDLVLARTTITATSEGERRKAVLQLVFLVTYHTAANAPGVAI